MPLGLLDVPPKRGGHVKTTPAQLRAVGSSGLCRKLLKLCPQLFGAGDLALIELHAQSVADVALQEQRVLADTISSHLLKQPGLEISRSQSHESLTADLWAPHPVGSRPPGSGQRSQSAVVGNDIRDEAGCSHLCQNAWRARQHLASCQENAMFESPQISRAQAAQL